MRILIKCDYCNKDFLKAKSGIKRNKNHFCSQECHSNWQKINYRGEKNPFYNKHHTAVSKEKISVNNSGCIPWNKDKKMEFNHKIDCQCGVCKAKRGEYKEEQNPNFGNHWIKKDRITELHIAIRNLYKTNEWRSKVYKKDNYTCQECGDNKGGNLEGHHIKEFNIILHEFLQLYSQFSPIEDKETLVRLAITYEPFWDINNGITLCEECHNKIEHNKEIYKKLK